MSEQNQQEAATPVELSETSLESVSGGTNIVDGGCNPDFPGGCILVPIEPTVCF